MGKSKLIFLSADDENEEVYVEAFINVNNNVVIKICDGSFPGSILIELDKETALSFSKRINSLSKTIE